VLAEDLRFALATKRAGGRLVLADGAAVLTCRMYANFGEAWRGLARNALPAALDSGPFLAAFVLAWAILFVLPPIVLIERVVRRLAGRRDHHEPSARLALAATVGQLALRLIVGRRHGWPLWDVALQPVSAALLPVVLLDSWRRHRSGAVIWRGRRCS
jgi:hypothetical protein